MGSRILRALAVAAGAFAFAAGAAAAEAWPARPVRIVVAFQAGQGTDVATRYIASQLSAALGQNFVVDNRPGAEGTLGTSIAAKSAPDGYTLLMGTAGTHAMNPALHDNPGFDPDTSFDAIALTCLIPMAISAHPSANVSKLSELVAAARARPDKIDVALPSVTSRLVVELLRKQEVPLFGVTYKGSATASADVLGGQVPVLVDTVGATRAHVGKLKVLAVTSARESALMPGVPSVAEQGLPKFEVVAWNVLMAPRGTPPEIIERLALETRKILAQPETTRRLRDLGFDAAPAMSPAEVAAFVKSEQQKFGSLIRGAGMKSN
ncbi:MAG: tripartite tricarboxylate transporter substrate-binding protein [Burkholderiaceae bacterium]